MIKNLNKVNPTKLNSVIKGMDFIENENKKEHVIDKVILFGSSIRDDCTSNSDIDLCLVTNFSCKNMTFFNIFGKLPLIMDENCDILVYSKLKGSIKASVDKGVVIYES